MDTREQIEKAFLRFDGLFPEKGQRPWRGDGAYAKAFAEHLVAVLPPTVDELVGMLREYENQDNHVWRLDLYATGCGSVWNSYNGQFVHWPATDTPGKTAIEAIKAAMEPEPTAKEKAIRALEQIRLNYNGFAVELDIIRKALGGQ